MLARRHFSHVLPWQPPNFIPAASLIAGHFLSWRLHIFMGLIDFFLRNTCHGHRLSSLCLQNYYVSLLTFSPWVGFKRLGCVFGLPVVRYRMRVCLIEEVKVCVSDAGSRVRCQIPDRPSSSSLPSSNPSIKQRGKGGTNCFSLSLPMVLYPCFFL